MIAVIQTESVARKGHAVGATLARLGTSQYCPLHVDSPNRAIFQTHLPRLSEQNKHMSSIFVLGYTTAPTTQFPKNQNSITSTMQAVQGEGNKCSTN